jgi:putative salt-induced outer membrane protein YdiY
MLSMLRLTAPAAALLIVTALPARADEVRLNNGDRITGQTISMVNGALSFKTASGSLIIPWADVTLLDISNPVYVVVAGNRPLLTGVSPGTAPGYAALDPGGPVLLADIVAITFSSGTSWERTGGAGAGFVQTAGNTQISNVRLSADLMLKGGSNRYTLNGAATRAKDRGTETARNWSGTAKYDRFITSRIFANANTVLTNDRFRDIDLRGAYGAGGGVQLIDAPRATLTGSGGMGIVDENFISIPDNRYTATYESADLKIELVPDRLRFFHLHDGFYQVTRGDRKFFRMQNGIRISIVSGFVATLQEDFDYDRHPSPGRKQTDATFALTLGYRF